MQSSLILHTVAAHGAYSLLYPLSAKQWLTCMGTASVADSDWLPVGRRFAGKPLTAKGCVARFCRVLSKQCAHRRELESPGPKTQHESDCKSPCLGVRDCSDVVQSSCSAQGSRCFKVARLKSWCEDIFHHFVQTQHFDTTTNRWTLWGQIFWRGELVAQKKGCPNGKPTSEIGEINVVITQISTCKDLWPISMISA